MTSEHIYRDWSNHQKEIIRPYEAIKCEIFSFDHELTQKYTVEDIITKSNAKKVSHRHLTCFESKDTSSFTIHADYTVRKLGEYRIDLLYENKDKVDLLGSYAIKLINKSSDPEHKPVRVVGDTGALNPKLLFDEVSDADKYITFDGETNIVKRKTLFVDFDELGSYDFAFTFPSNCYFIGLVIRRIITFTGDNSDSMGTSLQFTDADLTFSGQSNVSEATLTIGYSQTFENPYSQSNFYFDYMDEVNIYIKETGDIEDTKLIQRFGGYISSVKSNEDLTKLTISCADRLIDGQNKYILDSLLILDGTADEETSAYYNPINFNSYGEALKYLCDIHEVTLQSNIAKNFLVEGEKYNTGLSLTFGKKKDITSVTSSHATSEPNDNFIMLRNDSEGQDGQSITVYNAKDHSKLPITLKNKKESYLTFHMTYGLGDPKTESKTTTIDASGDGGSGSLKWGKCGQSSDKKYVMGIGQPSAGKGGYSYNTIYKTVFKNKCPHCGSTDLRWDAGRSGTSCIYCGPYHGSKRTWGPIPETEITCNSCCADYCAVTGYEKDWGHSTRLTIVSNPVTSSKAEQNKLFNGELVADVNGVAATSTDVLKEVATIAKKYTYKLYGNTTSSYSDMKKSGYGDCWAFSDCIFTELKARKVSCKILDYATSMSSHHRSVMYKNANNEWEHFPYKKYDVFPSMLNYTSNWKNASVIKTYNGGSIADASSSSGSSTETSEVTTTWGYDKEKPFQAYIELTYSTVQSWTAEKKKIELTFTQTSGSDDAWRGLTNYWINNSMRQTAVDMSGYFADNEPNEDIYLHSIRFVAPKIEKKETDDKTVWYTFDKSTQDFSSCKMDLYNIIFDDSAALNPTDLQACGKTVLSLMQDIVKASGYNVSMEYAKHRCDDTINFRVDKHLDTKFVATEGDNNNILHWSNITYTPVQKLRNKSICVFKKSDGKYAYVDTGDLSSMLDYGEQITLTTVSDQISSKEAYYTARNSNDYNPEQSYSYTIVVPYAPNLKLGDLVEVISNNKELNDVKPLESLKVSYDIKQMPRIKTELGLDELEPFLRIKKEQEQLRKSAKEKTTYFGRTATPINDPTIYIWDN